MLPLSKTKPYKKKKHWKKENTQNTANKEKHLFLPPHPKTLKSIFDTNVSYENNIFQMKKLHLSGKTEKEKTISNVIKKFFMQPNYHAFSLKIDLPSRVNSCDICQKRISHENHVISMRNENYWIHHIDTHASHEKN